MTKYTPIPWQHRSEIVFGVEHSIMTRTLNDIMEHEHVIEVHADGSVSDGLENIYAPEVQDGQLEPFQAEEDGWTLIGRSGQQNGGHIMGNGEYIGGGLADEILETPGYYVAIVCNWECTHGENEEPVDDCDENHVEGWAVAYRPLG